MTLSFILLFTKRMKKIDGKENRLYKTIYIYIINIWKTIHTTKRKRSDGEMENIGKCIYAK